VPTYHAPDSFEHLDTSALPPRQQRILVTIRDWVVKHGYAPSSRQIGEAVGLRSSSSVSKHLASLEDKGFLNRGATVSRPIDVRLFLQDSSAPRPAADTYLEPRNPAYEVIDGDRAAILGIVVSVLRSVSRVGR
jgi:repressor LexA